jgi:hypothetical protein
MLSMGRILGSIERGGRTLGTQIFILPNSERFTLLKIGL